MNLLRPYDVLVLDCGLLAIAIAIAIAIGIGIGIGDVCAAIAHTIAHTVTLLGATSQRFVPGRSQPRKEHRIKPHPSCA